MQFGINSTCEWLIIAQSEAERNYTIHDCRKKHAIDWIINLAKLTAHYKVYNMYENVWGQSHRSRCGPVEMTGPWWVAIYPLDSFFWGIAPNRLTYTLDNFIFFGRPNQCTYMLTTATTWCNKFGVPLALDKLLGPSTVFPFLGIELDTDTMELRLPADKLHSLQSLIKSRQGKKSHTNHSLLSLTGHLQHVAKAVKPGRTFIRRMIDLATTAKELHHLNRGFQSNLLWLATFLNGMKLTRYPPSHTCHQINKSINHIWCIRYQPTSAFLC